MEIGDPGQHGVPAASLVKVEPSLAPDSAIVLPQPMVVLNVPAAPQNLRLATPRVALQVDSLF